MKHMTKRIGLALAVLLTVVTASAVPAAAQTPTPVNVSTYSGKGVGAAYGMPDTNPNAYVIAADRPLDVWYIISTPGENAKASVTVPAPGIGKMLVVTGVHFSMVSDSVGSVGYANYVHLWGPVTLENMMWAVALPSGPFQSIRAVDREDFRWGMQGGTATTPGEPATLEFEAAGGPHTFQTVMISGFTVPSPLMS